MSLWHSQSDAASAPPALRALGLLCETAKRLLEAPHPTALIDELQQQLAEHLGLEIALHYRYDAEARRLAPVARHGPDAGLAQRMEMLSMEDTMGREVTRQPQPIFAEHVQETTDPALTPLREVGAHMFCSLPLMKNQTLIGAVAFASQQREQLSPQEKLLLQAMVDLLSVSIQRAEGEEERDRLLEGERLAREELTHTTSMLRGLNNTLEDRVQQRTQDLVRYQTQLRNLVSELILTEQRERRRIAGELHDHLAQLLVACKMKLSLLRGHTGGAEADDPSGADGEPATDQDNANANANANAKDKDKDNGNGNGKDNSAGIAPEQVLDELDSFLDQSLSYTRTLVAQISPVLLYQQGLAAAICWLAETVMPRHGLTVHVEADDELPAESLNEEMRIMLFESVRELLFNVLRHSGADHATVTMRQRDGGLELAVIDAGRGFRSETAPLEGVDPHGFGLFSIRERMTLLGGHFQLSSSPGAGTRAVVWAPLTAREAEADEVLQPTVPAAPVSGPSPATRRGTSTRVLVVDDHAVVREGLMMMLGKEQGIIVVGEADNGRSALEMAERLAPDVVLMDVSMPEMDGIETTSQLTAQHEGIRVIGLSMYEDESIAASMREAGAVDYLCKGCSPEALVETISRACQPA